VLRTKILDIGTQRGDVMVFFPPHMNKTYYIKRVIGLPGDVVSYRNKRLYVNGEPVPLEPLAVLPEGRSRYQLSLADFGGRQDTCSRSICCVPAARFHGDRQARSLLHDGRQSRQLQ
jgi:signal peptidase I